MSLGAFKEWFPRPRQRERVRERAPAQPAIPCLRHGPLSQALSRSAGESSEGGLT